MNVRRFRTRASLSAACALGAVLLSACTPSGGDHDDAGQAPTVRVPFGTAMADVGRRFELLGRAAVAGRYELADYELGEIGEQFEDTLPHAAPPREGHPEVLPELVTAFVATTMPDLQKALGTHDLAAATAAFERAAVACNACHQASGHGFIEVPRVPGRPVPVTDPVAR